MELSLAETKKWIELFVGKVESEKSQLNELDTAIGDGDHGTNMDRGMKAITDAFEKKNPEDIAGLYKTVAFALIQKVGGASGPLYGTAFLDMSKKAKDDKDLTKLVQTGLAGLKRRGQSDFGMKTMIDVWEPVAQALENNQFTQSVLDDALANNKALVATKGRASYLEEKSKGHIDPGAQSSAYLFEALLTVLGA
ncbi:dihydroxyacetone kinase subunit DhaL [Companilactobacillus sp. HBUAS56257]|uniref:dihydroxyacetone kinase subunit DhaL n=1 Tax=Companilactobacillus sp. HBUAS56257 TaxID=3109360 RepID=UPI002FF06ED8